MQRLPNPPDPDHLAAIEFSPLPRIDEHVLALVSATATRRTDRRPYLPDPLPDPLLAQLIGAALAEKVTFTVLKQPAARREVVVALAHADATQRANPMYYQDRIIGIVSEADLLAQPETQHQQRWHRWHRNEPRPRLRTGKKIAVELMTTPAITVGTSTDITTVSRLLAARDIKRVPVVDVEGCLLGIVSRHDLVRVFVRPDDVIRTEIREDVLLQALWVDPIGLDVEVYEGVVTLRGQLERRSLVAIAGSLCQRVNGVVDVVNRLTYALDDSTVGNGTKPQNIGVLDAPWGQH